jgi:hypothetical protein
MGVKYLHPSIFISQLMADVRKPCNKWSETYEDSNNPESFKLWLKMMFDNNRKLDMREGFGFSPISNSSGILTYRFLKFFTDLGIKLYSKKLLTPTTNLFDLWDKHKIANFFIRMEHLENDLIKALQFSKVNMSNEQIDLLINSKNEKTNTSSHLNTSYYYDEDTIKLINERENLIIKLFNYKPPK